MATIIADSWPKVTDKIRNGELMASGPRHARKRRGCRRLHALDWDGVFSDSKASKHVKIGAALSLSESMDEVAERLHNWAGLPKFALERRVDALLTPFLATFLKAKLKAEKVELVAPEFPILSGLAKLGKPRDSVEFEPTFHAHSVNVDYLLYAEIAGKASWVLLELKTDSGSFDPDQASNYALARQWRMPRLIEHIRFISSRTEPKNRKKYDTLLNLINTGHALDADIVVAYLGPDSLSTKVLEVKSDDKAKVDHFFGLFEFLDQPSSWIPEKHLELWEVVRKILK
jgi:hypothetical protein